MESEVTFEIKLEPCDDDAEYGGPGCNTNSELQERRKDTDNASENHVTAADDDMEGALPIHFQTNSKNKKSASRKTSAGQTFGAESDTEEKNDKGVKLYHCAVCSEKYRVPLKLKQHIAKHDVVERSVKCGECFKVFKHLSKLKEHLIVHTGEKNHKCLLCMASFAVPTHLENHIRMHTGEKPFKCDQCPAQFAQSSGLRRHKTIHSDEKPYKCDQCTAEFKQISYLRRHLRIHTGEKNYLCKLCPAAFTDASVLKKHMKSHSDVRPYHCDYCKAQFKHASHLKRHILRRNHENKIDSKDQDKEEIKGNFEHKLEEGAKNSGLGLGLNQSAIASN